MQGQVAETSFVIRFMEEFYEQVTRYKQKVLGRQYATPQDDTFSNPLISAQTIRDALVHTLKTQALDAPRNGGEFAADFYRETQFVMVALADEIFLNIKWEGRSHWEDNLIESQLFGTHTAGEMLFQKLENFLQERDTVRTDVAYVYLMALGLGFRGKYRGIDDQGRLNVYKRALYKFIYHRESTLFEGDAKICPEAYIHVATHSEGKRLHDFRPWFFAFGLIILGLLFISYTLWFQETAPLEKTLSQIFETHERLVRRSL